MELNLDEVTAVAALGLTLEEIAHYFGMSRATFNRRREEFEQIDTAINKGRAVAKAKMVNVIFDAGIKGNIGAAVAYLKMYHTSNETVVPGQKPGGAVVDGAGVLVVPGTATEEREWEERAIEQQRRLLEHHADLGSSSG